MKLLRNALACGAAAALMVSQSALAAPAAGTRTASPVAGGERLGPEGSTPVIALISLLLLVGAIMAITDGDGDDEPVSP